ncbi:MAG TPA: hypothetical protein DCW98_05105 [Bacteroidales bacterium]|jgi:type IX secretion system PorP/SprF family membrane protein|nr:hypothetical protein [Bacteroidales bacterium]
MSAKYKLFFAVVILCLSSSVKAQYDIHFAHFWAVKPFYNPAGMSWNGQLNVAGALSMQMAGYRRAPVSMYLGADTELPFDRGRHSGGAGLFNETIGLFTNRRMFFNYGYRFHLGRKGWLNIGLQGGVMSMEFDGTRIDAETSGDPAFPTSRERGSTGDLGAGLMYSGNEWYLGLSAQHLNIPHIEFGKGVGKRSEMDIKTTFYMNSGYNIQLKNPFISLQPCILVQSDLDFFRTDLSARATYEYDSFLFYGGLTWSPGVSIAVLAGGRYKGVLIGYAYELYTGDIGYLNGSHDLVVSWQTDIDFFGRGRNAHKSVRYL